ncbi:MAG: S8 family serine peptidase [Bacteroidota bacterium]|nr:S8 family serine peptidase [Bacteroidota bacterium]
MIENLTSVLTNNTNVIYAEPHGYGAPDSDPNDQHFSKQWALKNTGEGGGTIDADIDADEAWDITTGSSDIKIGIIDDGMQTDHPDFIGRVTGDLGDNSRHGTVVAGIAAAQGNNNIGIAGVAWNVGIINEDFGNYTDAEFTDAVRSASQRGSHVINNSWRLIPTGRYSQTVRLAFADAYKLNIVATASMGNQYVNVIQYPAAFGQGIITVGATTNDNEKAEYSSTGNWIDVVAPGGVGPGEDVPPVLQRQIYSTVPNSSYDYVGGGTSWATPHVTGIAALMLSYKPNLYNDDIENIVQLSAEDKGPIGFDEEYGYGRVNARRALDLLRYPYLLNHYTHTGGTVYSSTGQYNMFLFGLDPATGLPDGEYKVRRHEVRANVTFPSIFNIKVWGRGVATKGWNVEEVVQNVKRNFTLGFCESVSGTATSLSATMRTYLYELWDVSGTTYYGYFPTTPSDVIYAYTVLGSTIPPFANIIGKDTLNEYESWQYSVNIIGGSGNYLYQWYRKDDGASNWIARGFQQTQVETMFTQNFSLKCEVHDNILNFDTSATKYVIRYYEAPTIPQNLTVSRIKRIFSGYVFYSPKLTWKRSMGPLVGYKVYKKENEYSEFAHYATTTDTFYTDFAVEMADTGSGLTNLFYYVTAYNNNSESNPSNTVGVGCLNCRTYELKLAASDDNPTQYELYVNYPNPFNPKTQVRYAIPENVFVNLRVYDMLGRQIATLVNEYQEAGYKSIDFDATNLPSGFYIYKLTAGKYVSVKKMLLVI